MEPQTEDDSSAALDAILNWGLGRSADAAVPIPSPPLDEIITPEIMRTISSQPMNKSASEAQQNHAGFLSADAFEQYSSLQRRRRQVRTSLLGEVDSERFGSDPDDAATKAFERLNRLLDRIEADNSYTNPADQRIERMFSNLQVQNAAVAPTGATRKTVAQQTADALNQHFHSMATSKSGAPHAKSERLLENARMPEADRPARPTTQRSQRQDPRPAPQQNVEDEAQLMPRLIQQYHLPEPIKFSIANFTEHQRYLELCQRVPPQPLTKKEHYQIGMVTEDQQQYTTEYERWALARLDLYKYIPSDVRDFVDNILLARYRNNVVMNQEQTWVHQHYPAQPSPSLAQLELEQEQFRQLAAHPFVRIASTLDSTTRANLPIIKPVDGVPRVMDLAALKSAMQARLKERPCKRALKHDIVALEHHLVKSGQIDVIAPASALATLFLSAVNPTLPWQLPFQIKEIAINSSPAAQNRSVLILEKPLPPPDLTPRAKNELFYSRALKSLVLEEAYSVPSSTLPRHVHYSTFQLGTLSILVRHELLGVLPEPAAAALSADTPPAASIIATTQATMSYFQNGAAEFADMGEDAVRWLWNQLGGPGSKILVGRFDTFQRSLVDVSYAPSDMCPAFVPQLCLPFLLTALRRIRDPAGQSRVAPEATAPASYVGLVSHRSSSAEKRAASGLELEFVQRAEMATTYPSNTQFFDLWAKMSTLGKTSEHLTWFRLPAWDFSRHKQAMNTFPPLTSLIGNKQNFCYEYSDTGVCPRGPECVYPHMTAKQAEKLKQWFPDPHGPHSDQPLTQQAHQWQVTRRRAEEIVRKKWEQLQVETGRASKQTKNKAKSKSKKRKREKASRPSAQPTPEQMEQQVSSQHGDDAMDVSGNASFSHEDEPTTSLPAGEDHEMHPVVHVADPMEPS